MAIFWHSAMLATFVDGKRSCYKYNATKDSYIIKVSTRLTS